MQIVTTKKAMSDIAKSLILAGKSLGFVPTMGCLHEGHISLVQSAKAENDVVVVSIFVNPSQFGPDEDFASYPRDFEHDRALLEGYCDYLFYPDQQEMYPNVDFFAEGKFLPGNGSEKITFQLQSITDCLCGLSRPNHFAGVCFILTKLFHIIKPNRAYFGQKDYQQTVVVRYLVQNFFFDTEIMVCPIVREADGLAMSSRNIHLSPAERKKANALYQSLLYGLDLLQNGEQNADLIIQKMQFFLNQKNITSIDYIDIRDAFSLDKVERIEAQAVVIALAVFFEKVRLIDNILYKPNETKK